MAESSDIKQEGASNPDQLVKLCKRRLENWREVLIHLHSLLIWEKPYFPGITAGIITLLFLLLWYCDLSVLTTLSLFGIVACILDYAVPILSSSVFDSSKWTGSQEKKFEEICHCLVGGYQTVKQTCSYVHQLKETKPYIYFFAVLGVLLFSAWIGNLINNILLSYLLVLFTALSPGIKSQPVVQDALASVQAMLGQSKKKK